GRLRCTHCPKEYPIVGGVPRFVRTDGYAASFGREWNWFSALQLDSFSGTGESKRTLHACTGWTDADYRGHLVLDAGVGSGRFAEIVARYGGEVVGVDLSVAVDAAYRNLGRLDHVHLVQADIFALPFRESTFDLAYSIGVLHHTPDPGRAFAQVAATVKPGGGLAVYLYDRYGIGRHSSDLIRLVTTRLPLRLTLALSAISILYYYPCRLPGVGKVLQLLWPISMHPHWRWRWLDTFDWYSPAYQWKLQYPEVCRWFRSNGFGEIDIFDGPIRMRGVKAPIAVDEAPRETRAIASAHA
ncbi:MAG: class I SAM-dependent methyltransferase, partial [Acidobacteria bacterium]|nr:class I SAM-dependent methyltransferase [Acidobacteriota bacterium]